MLPEKIPLFPLAGALLLPGAQLPLNIFEPRYLRMIDDALAGARMIGMIQPASEADQQSQTPDLYEIGCAGRITAFQEADDGRYLITLTGKSRFSVVEEIATQTPYRIAKPDWSDFEADRHRDITGRTIDREEFLGVMRDYLEAEGLKTDWEAAESAPIDALVASLAMGCPFAPNEKQALLEAKSVADRAECLVALMEMSGSSDTDNGVMLQ